MLYFPIQDINTHKLPVVPLYISVIIKAINWQKVAVMYYGNDKKT